MKFIFDAKKISSESSSSKARCDVTKILEKCGYKIEYINEQETSKKIDLIKNINFCYKQIKNRLSEIECNSTVLFQYPFDSLSYKFSKLIKKYATKKSLKTIVLIHDINTLRTSSVFGKMYYKLIVNEVKFLNNFDYIIAHNNKMKNFLVNNGIDSKKIVELGIFDYLVSSYPKNNNYDYKSVTIAGNLDINKAGYVYQLNNLYIKNYKIKLMGINYSGNESEKIKFYGSFDSTDLDDFKASGFGLVWDGNDYKTCNGGFGNYLKFNNPHKISLYLASGIPVIVWSESALADFVEQNKIGFTITSLDELDTIFESMTKEDYQIYLKNVKTIQKRVTNGNFLREALKKCGD